MPNYPQRKAPGPYEAISYMPHKQRFLFTRHETWEIAQRRLRGNSRHTHHRVIFHDPDVKVVESVKEEKPKKSKK